jgi:hypothetical protein
MRLLDLLERFDEALDWPLDDPLLADALPAELAERPWPSPRVEP